MKTLHQIEAVPESGVLVLKEGPLTRIFFDFEDAPAREDMPLAEDIKLCESIDVIGRGYAAIVSAIINDRYDADANQAIVANYELAKDMDRDISEAKRAEYLEEYAGYQAWRSHAKDVARFVVSVME